MVADGEALMQSSIVDDMEVAVAVAALTFLIFFALEALDRRSIRLAENRRLPGSGAGGEPK